jgi:hypothetical protein
MTTISQEELRAAQLELFAELNSLSVPVNFLTAVVEDGDTYLRVGVSHGHEAEVPATFGAVRVATVAAGRAVVAVGNRDTF